MQTFEEKRYEELSKLFSYLDGRKPVITGKGDNYMIVCYIGNYVDKAPNSAIRMVSVVDTEQAAHFIARWVKIRDKLTYLPKIYRTSADLYPSNKGSVREYLKTLATTRDKLKAKLEQRKNS